MRVILEVLSGPDTGRFVAVPHGTEVVVGRRPPAHFVIDGDPTLSRAHFALACDPPRCLVRDLGSTVGTLLNGEPVDRAEVRSGDVIEAGQTSLIVRIDARASSPRPSTTPLAPIPDRARWEGPPTEEVASIDAESPADPALVRLRSQQDPLFAILDAARDPLVLVRLMGSGERYQSLYEGPKGERLAAAAPYLVALPRGSPFLEVLVRDGWGNSWGVYLTCLEPFEAIRKHLRRFLTVRTEAGKELLFRYYDPRVLRMFLPTCTVAELAEFFGPIRCYLIEEERGLGPRRFAPDGHAQAARTIAAR
jgi:Domain of unknown function (DUF4123)/Inner membrane component of T3SS, cytoplasmic domain